MRPCLKEGNPYGTDVTVDMEATKRQSIYDVRTEGGVRLENWLILRTNSTDRLHEVQTNGGNKGV